MIRYKDNDTYRSAWRYSWVDGPIAGQKVLKIEAVPVKATLTIVQLNKDYFAKPEVRTYVKTIYFPATGWGYSQNGSGTSGEVRGIDSGWWSATSYDSNYAYSAYFTEDAGTGVNRDYKTSRRFAVRLFQGI